jgi:hypothetical protein
MKSVRETETSVTFNKTAHLEREQDKRYWEGMLAALKRGAKPVWIDDTGIPDLRETGKQ